MAEGREDMPPTDPLPEAGPEEAPRRRARSRPHFHAWQLWLAGLVLMLLAGVAGGLLWIDSPAGHRFVVQKVEQLRPQSGLRIGIGRIEGSLFRKAVVHDLRLYDPKGLFFSSPEIRLDWSPLGWLSNRLDIDELIVPQARLHKMPQFNKTEGTGRILPDFDIRVMRLRVDRLAVDRAVTGRDDIFVLEGDADVRGGQAVVDLSLRSLQGDDRLLLALDSRPDDNRFGIDLTVNAKAGGLISTMAGIGQDANVRLEGKGDWSRWDGRLIATLDRKSAAGFDIGLRKGDWKVEGTIAGSAIANDGLLARLTSPELSITAQGRFENRLLSGAFRARSEAIAVDVKGGVHLGGRGYDNLLIDVGLSRPQALLKSFDARGLVARVRLNGPFSTARFEYLLRADQLRFGSTVLRGVHAAGDGRGGGTGTTLIPLQLSAKSVEGQGDMVASILRNVSITGTLQKNGAVVTSSPMRLRSDKLDGQVVAMFDLSSGRYDIALGGDLRGLLIPGFGVVDIHSNVKAVPDRNGGFSLAGRVDATMRRLDVGFLRTIAGGLPKVRADIALGTDGRLFLRNLLLNAPALTLRGEGVRNRDGTVHLAGTGEHDQYGPLRLVLDGDIARPKVDLLLARPLDAAGLAEVQVSLDPDGHDYRLQANGQSYLGPFSAQGAIEMPPGGETVLAIDELAVNGSTGQGRLLVVDGGLAGRIDFEGSVRGPIDLSVVNGIQKAKAALVIQQALFPAATSIHIARGRLDADLSLDPQGTTIDARLVGNGVQVGSMRINRITAETRLVNGEGKLTAHVTGQRGRLFNMQIDADIAADEIGFGLTGTLDRQKISLDRKGRLRRVEGGWALDPLTIHYRGGKAIINSATFGSEVALDVGVQNLSLSLLDLSNVDLGLSGTASGRVIYSWKRESGTRGSASIKVKGLSRSGVTRTSTPVDIGLNAELTDARMAMRALISQDGKIIGKAQALMTPLGEGGLMERLRAAPIRAQLRYVGPASSLWRLSTIEIIDLRGQIAVTANISGTGADPVIDGALMTRDAVLESPITGMRMTKLQASGRFNGSRLVLSQISGSTGEDGTVTGRGVFDLGLGQGVGINIALQANKAVLLNRDDIGATVTGPVSIRSRDGVNGVISGDFDVVRSRFTMGRAAAVAEIPELRVIEKNRRGDVFEQAPRGAGWLLDIKANARNRLMVSGMGLSSEWRMDLTVGGQAAAPKIVGRADLVRGTYDFAGRRFDLSEGALRFDGSVPANPTLDIKAEASLSDLDATIDIGGTSLNPEIRFSSTPSLPEDEILSRILFGSSITSLSAPEALQLAAAVGSLQGGGGGLDPINAVRKAAGLDRLRILPADPTTGQGTSIGVGKYLTRKIYVELITDGQGYSATQLEYQITRWLSLLSAVSTLGRQSMTLRASKDY